MGENALPAGCGNDRKAPCAAAENQKQTRLWRNEDGRHESRSRKIPDAIARNKTTVNIWYLWFWGKLNGARLGHEDGAAITLQSGFGLLREIQLIPSEGTHQKLPLVNPPSLIHLGVWFILFEVKGLESCYKGIKRSPQSLPFKWEHGRDMRAF